MMNDAQADVVASPESLLGEIADDFLARFERGERPEIEVYAKAHPELAQVIREVFPALAAMRECSPGSLTEPATAAGLSVTHALGDYHIIRELGRGGMGIVYEAEQLSLGRHVALKVLPFAAALDQRQLQRFKNEAQAAANLHHTNIVPVYGIGCERGVHYYAMQLIEGQTLAQVIAEMRRHQAASKGQTPDATDDDRLTRIAGLDGDLNQATIAYAVNLTPVNGRASSAATVKAALSTEHSAQSTAYFRTVAQLGRQASEALDYAHGLGIIHRDIKPANMLIDARGNLWITDFGLAHVQTDISLTMTGDLVGTLRYMSPEQALAKRVIVDHRTDIYSLGATLYELFTLAPAFDGRDRHELLRQIAFDEPQLPRRRNSAIPAELETIVLKAIAKNPAERYATAQELADDLDRFLKDEPILAKRPSPLGLARKWARRHKPVVVSALIAAAAVAAIAVAALMINLANTSNALREKTAILEREQQTNYLQRIALAGRELAAGNVGHAEELLEDCPMPLRGWEWHFLKRQRYAGEPTPLAHSATVTRMALSPNGRWLASACYDGTFHIWDAQSRQRLYAEEPEMAGGRPVLVRGMTYSPDNRYLAVARHDGAVVVRDATKGQPLYVFKGHDGPAWQVAFSPDSKTLASAGTDKCVRLWDMTSGTAAGVFSENPAAIKGVAFRPDGRSVVAACEDGTVNVWDQETGRQTFSFRGALRYPFYAWFSPDARRLAWSCWDGAMSVWDTTTGELEFSKQTNTWQLRAISFHPDGKRIALAGFDGNVRLLDARTGHEMLTIFAHSSVVSHVVFSDDGNNIASASYDHTVRIWDAAPLPADYEPPHCVTLTGHQALVSSVAFSPDGRWLGSASWDGTVKLWENSRIEFSSVRPAAITPRYTLRGHDANLTGIAFSPDLRTVASSSWDKTVKLWDLKTPRADTLEELQTIPCAERVTAVAFSPDGRLLAIGQMNGIGLYDPASGEQAALFKPTPAPVPSLAFTPDSQYLGAAGASDPSIKFFAVKGAKMNFEIRNYSNPNLAISPDGRLVAAPSRIEAAAGSAVRIWEVLDWDAKTSQTHAERHTLSGHAGKVWKVVFSPDGRYLASGSWDSTIKVWDLKALAEEPQAEPVTLRGHAGFIYGLAFSPDGRRLASSSGYTGHGEVKIWDAVLWDKNSVHVD